MAPLPTLSALISAISNAVLHAQQKVDDAQILNLRSYFIRKPGKKGYTPITMNINLPSLRPEATHGETDPYQVPLLAVLPQNVLRIKEVDIDFSVNFAALDFVETHNSPRLTADELNGEPGAAPSRWPTLAVDLGALKKSDQYTTAQIHLSLEGVDMSESAARLINELIKTSQGYIHLKDGEDDGGSRSDK